MSRDPSGLDGQALDRYITGNYGEDQFKNDFDWTCRYCGAENVSDIHDEALVCEECGEINQALDPDPPDD